MAAASVIGASACFLGLLVSWYAQTSAGATIALLTVLVFFVVLVARRVRSALRYSQYNENHYQ
ncbi:metal ABC transporter permease [Brevibacterium sp. UCMA 11754]